ncbi:MAG: hypothetical protein CM1200mP40_28070 [Gammaproteobacteria bacterium]|nr:MAG: hypothetical protein CM1200mP40_28070 [Gammaproteobacteria bacterium]
MFLTIIQKKVIPLDGKLLAVQVVYSELEPGAVEYHPDLQIQPGDIEARQHWQSSGFANTDLDFLLKQNGLDHVVLAGMRANTCIESTARYAVELGYHTTMLTDAVGVF